jgi:hypothetical protein
MGEALYSAPNPRYNGDFDGGSLVSGNRGGDPGDRGFLAWLWYFQPYFSAYPNPFGPRFMLGPVDYWPERYFNASTALNFWACLLLLAQIRLVILEARRIGKRWDNFCFVSDDVLMEVNYGT